MNSGLKGPGRFGIPGLQNLVGKIENCVLLILSYGHWCLMVFDDSLAVRVSKLLKLQKPHGHPWLKKWFPLVSIFRIPSFPLANHRWAPQVGRPNLASSVSDRPPVLQKRTEERSLGDNEDLFAVAQNGTQESCYATGFGSPLVPLSTHISIEPIGGRSIVYLVYILDARSGWQRSELPHTFELPN